MDYDLNVFTAGDKFDNRVVRPRTLWQIIGKYALHTFARGRSQQLYLGVHNRSGHTDSFHFCLDH